MKYLIILLFAVTALTSLVQPVKSQGSKEITYYRIYADVKSDPLFRDILKETRLDDVFMTKFQMVVNTGGKDPFIVIGRYESVDVEWDPNAYRYDWLFLSKPVRDRLAMYPKKIKL
ncbi:MAG: hypothetical protein ABI543_12815 [Ignavibacteria bacterium]